MKIATRRSPIAAHFGAMDTRILQLKGSRRNWSVRAAEVVDASGESRQTRVAEQLTGRLRDLRLRGKDCLVSLSGEEFAVSLVPVDPHNRSRMQQTLKETAARAVKDPEGVVFRYLPLAGGQDEDTATVVREEYLLLALGSSVLRRCNAAVEHLNWRPVSLEASAFPLARTLNLMQEDVDEPWGFLHIGYSHSMFGIMLNGELRFLKPMQLTAERLIGILQDTLERDDDATSADELSELISGGGEDAEDKDAPVQVGSETVVALNQKAVGHATEILHALRLEAEALAQEVRACLRHFANRYRGAKLASMLLSGTGAALPEVETALHNALSLPTSVARPFTELGIEAPEHVLSEEHQWCIPLGLALRDWT